MRADNERLESIRSIIKDYYNQLQRENKPVSAQLLKNLYLGKEKLHYTLLEAYQLFLEEREKLCQIGEFAPSTIESYKTRLRTLTTYLKTIKKETVALSEFTIKFGLQYLLWLKTKERKITQNPAMRHIRGVSQVLDFAVINEWLAYNPLASFPYKFEKPKDPVYLTPQELAFLEAYQFEEKDEKLSRVADLFLFQSYTGFAYSELASFCLEEDVEIEEAITWIVKQRRKTAETAILPLVSKAEQLLSKYGGALPVISNQKYNDYLKELGQLLGFRKNMTSHVARKTAANLWLNNGVPPETVARMLGQSDVKTLMRFYAQVSEGKIARDLKVLG